MVFKPSRCGERTANPSECPVSCHSAHLIFDKKHSVAVFFIEILEDDLEEAGVYSIRASAFKLLEQLLQLNIACQKSVGPNFQLSS